MIVIILFESCQNKQNKKEETSMTLPSKDSSRYTQLKGRFYIDKSKKLFEKKQYIVNGKGDFYDRQIYFDSIVVINVGDSVIEKTLSEIMDITTFTEFENGTLFSKDKNYVYYSYVSTGGEDRVIVNSANPKTFKPLSDYQYGIDDKHVFYQSKMIKGLNFKKHKILYSLDTADFSIDYVKDDKVVFYCGDTLKGADAKTFKLVSGQKWSAEDKAYKYECCGQHFILSN
jgi:DKNYY family